MPEQLVAEMRLRAKRVPRRHLSKQDCSNDQGTSQSGHCENRQGGLSLVVQLKDVRLNKREKFASAHDLRRGVAQRLINNGVSAETLKVVMRHKDFATTERHYGAVRSAQSAAAEIVAKTVPSHEKSELVGGLMGGHEKTPQLSAEELGVLKALLSKL